jgi:hypothetical protein
MLSGAGIAQSGIESRWGRDFSHMSRPSLGPTQPPVQWVQGLSRGQSSRGVVLNTHTLLAARSRKSRAIPLPSSGPSGLLGVTLPLLLPLPYFKYPLFLSDFNGRSIFVENVSKNTQIQNLFQFRLVETEVLNRTDRRRDRQIGRQIHMTNLIVAY